VGLKDNGTRISADLAGFKGMERGFSRIWRIFADFFGRAFKSVRHDIRAFVNLGWGKWRDGL